MGQVIHRLKAFAPLRDPASFREVQVIADGLGVGWKCGLDYAARSLQLLAKRQSELK